MKSVLINKEYNRVKIEMSVDAVEFENAVEAAYKKTKSKYKIAGFRQGKAPRKIIELNYGKGVFFNDAMDILLPQAYSSAVVELDLHPVGMPEVGIKEIAEDGSVVFEAEVDVLPEIELPEYKGIEIEKIEKHATEEDIEEAINNLREKQARLIAIDGPVEKGNIANIDFVGYVDGEVFEGGSAKEYKIVVGDGSFIPGFEDQMVGKPVGEEFEVNVIFPDEYPAPELCGKPVVFKVTVNSLERKELPELNDDFVKDTTEFESVEELKNDIKVNLDMDLAKVAINEMRTALVDKLVDKVEVSIPDSMVEAKLDEMFEELNMQLSYQGWSLDTFCELSGQTIEEIRETRKEEALASVKKDLVVNAVMKAENIVATDEDVENDMKQFAEAYGLDLEAIKKNVGERELESIKNKLSIDKTLDFLLDSAKLV